MLEFAVPLKFLLQRGLLATVPPVALVLALALPIFF
jgi:hypothetical protein